MKVMMYTKPACPFCDQAKALLRAREVQYDVVNLDVGQKKEPGETYIPVAEFKSAYPTQRTVPFILRVDEDSVNPIGGYPELQRYLSTAH